MRDPKARKRQEQILQQVAEGLMNPPSRIVGPFQGDPLATREEAIQAIRDGRQEDAVQLMMNMQSKEDQESVYDYAHMTPRQQAVIDAVMRKTFRDTDPSNTVPQALMNQIPERVQRQQVWNYLSRYVGPTRHPQSKFPEEDWKAELIPDIPRYPGAPVPGATPPPEPEPEPEPARPRVYLDPTMYPFPSERQED
jgi:hypothetical protein